MAKGMKIFKVLGWEIKKGLSLINSSLIWLTVNHTPDTGPGTDDAEKNKQRNPVLRCLQLIKKIKPYKQPHARMSHRC